MKVLGSHPPERHDQSFEKALLGFEGSLQHIKGFNWYLLITELQINLAEIFGPLELVKKVINPWDWIPILDSDLVQRPIINTESPGPILLLCQHDW